MADEPKSNITIKTLEDLRAELEAQLRSAPTRPVVATPDGPHYRTAVQAKSVEGVEYMPAQTLAIARSHALLARSVNERARIQVTHNLGQTWTDCADDGGPVATATPGEEP